MWPNSLNPLLVLKQPGGDVCTHAPPAFELQESTIWSV